MSSAPKKDGSEESSSERTKSLHERQDENGTENPDIKEHRDSKAEIQMNSPYGPDADGDNASEASEIAENGKVAKNASPLTPPLMKIIPPLKLDVSKLFNKVTFCLKLINDKENYDDLKDTILEYGGTVTDLLTTDTDMLLVEYNANLREIAIDKSSKNAGGFLSAEDKIVIIEAISNNITVAMDIYVWQCILNSDLVPIDDFELVRTVENNFSFSMCKKVDLINMFSQTNRDLLTVTEHSHIGSPSPMPRRVSPERYARLYPRLSHSTHYPNRRKSPNKSNVHLDLFRAQGKQQWPLRSSEILNMDSSSDINGSDDNLYNTNLVNNLQYYKPDNPNFNKNVFYRPDLVNNTHDPVQDFVLNCSYRSSVSYLNLMCPPLAPAKNNWGYLLMNSTSNVENEYYASDINALGYTNSLQMSTPMCNNTHRHPSFSKETDSIFQYNSHINIPKYSLKRSTNNRQKDYSCENSSFNSIDSYECSHNSSSDHDEASVTDKQSESKNKPIGYTPDILLNAGAKIDVVPNTAHAERLEWSSALRHIMVSDFIRIGGNKTLDGSAVDSSPKPDAGHQIWIEIRANLHGISIDEELKLLETQKKRGVIVLEEVLRASFADTAELTVYDQVIDLLERVSYYKSLFPSSKVLKSKNPHFFSPNLQKRLDALTAWLNIKNSMVNNLYLINTWVQSKKWPAKSIEEIFTSNKGTDLSSIEIFIKKMPLIREFQRRIINTLNKALLMIKNAIADNAKTFHRMKLPVDTKDLGRLAQFSSNMIVETLKIQIQLSEVFTKHGDTILEHAIDSFGEDLSLSLKVKEMCKDIDQSSDGWIIESCLSSSFNPTILKFVKCYFSFMKLRLLEASEQVFFKEAELVKSKWTFMMKVRDTIECTNVEIAIQFCRLASELINRLLQYIKYHTYHPLDLNTTLMGNSHNPTLQQETIQQGNMAQAERVSKHCSRIIDNTKSRACKLLGLFKMLKNEFENCSEYKFTNSSVRLLLDRLAETRHILVKLDLYYSRKVIICASPSLMNSPHKIINLLKNCPKRTVVRTEDPCSYVLVILLKKHLGFGFKWKGFSIQINLQKILKSIDMEQNTIRLIVENTGLLSNSRQKFETIAAGMVKNIKVKKAHIELVENELKKIRETTLNLSLAIYPLAKKISFLLSPTNLYELQPKSNDINQLYQTLAGQNYEIVQETYMFSSDFAFKNTRRFYKGKKAKYIQSRLLDLSLGWIEYCTNTDESDLPPEVMRNVYNWHITALKFLTNITNGSRILLSSKSDFDRLKNVVSECLSKVSKMCASAVEVDNCEKVNINLDYRFDSQNDPSANVINDGLSKKASDISLKSSFINSMQIYDLHDEIYPISLFRNKNKSDNNTIRELNTNKNDIPSIKLSSSNILYSGTDSNITTSPLKPENDHSKSAESLKKKPILPRIGAFDKISDVFSVTEKRPNDTEVITPHKSHVNHNYKTDLIQSTKESCVNKNEPHSQYNEFAPPNISRSLAVQHNCKQELTKYVPHKYFGQVHMYKNLGRRLFSGVENLYMLQKKNRWRRKINELEEKIASKQRSLCIIGKMLDNTSYEDRNISLIAKNSSSISMRWRQGPYIGSGSFGDVYVGTNLETGDTMAVKEIKFIDARNLEKLAKFIIEEMNVLQMLHHPNIIDYYGIEVFRDRMYIFMECCKYSLAKVVGCARFSDEKILRVYTKHLLRGLVYLHGNGVIHRDIKPANILFSKEGRIKYVDFGASKIFKNGDNLVGYNGDTRTLVGTPQYIAPEVVNNEVNNNAGSRDVWALGCCILQMFTGRPPWGNTDNDWAIMWQIGTSKEHPEIPPPPILNEDAVNFLEKCFITSARERPTAEELMSHKWTADVEGECPDLSYIEKLMTSAPSPK